MYTLLVKLTDFTEPSLRRNTSSITTSPKWTCCKWVTTLTECSIPSWKHIWLAQRTTTSSQSRLTRKKSGQSTCASKEETLISKSSLIDSRVFNKANLVTHSF